MKPFDLRSFLRELSKGDKENIRGLATLKTMDQLKDLRNTAVENDNEVGKKMLDAALYLRAFHEGGVV